MTKKTGFGLGGLLLAGAAAFAYYKFSKMSDQQKKDMVNGIREKGKKFYDESIQGNLKNLFNKKETAKDGFTHA